MILKTGDKAPDFTAKDQNGNTVSLHDYLGKDVALYFYPKDNTPGCTEQACNIRDNFAELKQKAITILGVSVDSQRRHKNFENKFSLPFTLIADEDKTVVNEYGVWAEKKLWGKAYMGILRTTFLINKEGVIEHIITKVDTKEHAAQILEVWGK